MPHNQIAFVELPTTDIRQLNAFYHEHFGWVFRELGESYADLQQNDLGLGLNPNEADRTKAPLVLIESDDVDALEARLRKAGVTISMGAFNYPGGRRFHFIDPSGNELGAFQVSTDE